MAIDQVFHGAEPGETFCVGGRNELTNLDLIAVICDQVDSWLDHWQNRTRFPKALVSKSQSLIQFVDDRLGHDFRYAIDDSQF